MTRLFSLCSQLLQVPFHTRASKDEEKIKWIVEEKNKIVASKVQEQSSFQLFFVKK
jgi:hypothetical protein